MKPSRIVLELEDLRSRLREAEETLSAIRNGEVDSLIVSGPAGSKVFSLRGAEQPYRVFVEQMQQGAVTVTPDDATILYANRRFSELLGIPLQNIIGSRLTDYTDSTDATAIHQALTHPDGAKLQLVLKSQNIRTPVGLALSSLPLDDGNDAICIVITDLTEFEQKRELVRTLGRLTETQEKLHAQNEELRAARKAAESASEAKDEFLATLSHELRTPLTPVLVAAQGLESDPALPDALRPELAMIRRNIELEARLIDDLLDLTRIVRGKVELRPITVNLNDLLKNVLETCDPDICAQSIYIETAFDLDLPPVKGDPVRLQQVLWNLVRNAIKFTPPGGTVTLRTLSKEGRAIAEVIDTGIGMTPETVQRIFSPFEQAGREITRRFGGLGLGLAISRKLTEMHQGTLTASSAGPHKGSTFTLSLPAMLPIGRPPAPTTKPTDAHPRRLRILLVEDHEDTRRSMLRLLSLDHDVRPADSVASALETANKYPFDLLISDLGLPDGTGLDLIRSLRQLRANVRGICLSGYGMAEDISNSKNAGFAHHLTKPVSITHLRAAIADAAPPLYPIPT